jgi:hypothetical protein
MASRGFLSLLDGRNREEKGEKGLLAAPMLTDQSHDTAALLLLASEAADVLLNIGRVRLPSGRHGNSKIPIDSSCSLMKSTLESDEDEEDRSIFIYPLRPLRRLLAENATTL